MSLCVCVCVRLSVISEVVCLEFETKVPNDVNCMLFRVYILCNGCALSYAHLAL